MKTLEKVSYKSRYTRQRRSRGKVRSKRQRYYTRHKAAIKRRSHLYKRKNRNFLHARAKKVHYTRIGE